MAKSKKLEGSDLEKETLLLDVEELEQKTSRERATKIATSRRLAQAWIFALDISYGMYGTLSSYFLTEIIYGTDDDEKAVGLSTYYMIVWCSCNFLTAPVLGSVTDLVGRRPILLIGALTDTLAFPFMAAARTPTAVLLGAACIGTLDCTYNVCKSIIVDAVVAEMPLKKWEDGTQLLDSQGYRVPDGVHGSRHWLQLKSSKQLVEADLNEFNHAIQRFNSKDDYEKMRVDHCSEIVENNSKVEDAITGNTLLIKDQLVKVDVKASSQGATNKLLGKTVEDVNTLCDILLTPSPKRAHGEHPMQPLLMRAGPGTGKTWMCKQAVWMLADRLVHTNDWKGVRLVPLVMYVQQIIYLLRDVKEGDENSIRGRALMDKYCQEVHAKHAEMQRVLEEKGRKLNEILEAKVIRDVTVEHER